MPSSLKLSEFLEPNVPVIVGLLLELHYNIYYMYVGMYVLYI